MIWAVAILIFLILLAVSGAHFYWAFGGAWPATSRATLPHTVVGSEQMPPAWLTIVVATLIFGAALVPIIWLTMPFYPRLIWAATAGLTAIFALRGMVSFTGFFRNNNAPEPFLTLDRKYYGPLCLALAIGLGYLLVQK